MNATIGCYSFAVVGGLLAQAPDPNVGTAGILIAVTGLIGGLTSAGKMYLDWRLKMRELDITKLASELAKTQAELAESRQNAHERADKTNGILVDLQERVGKNAETAQAVAPVVRHLAEQSGLYVAIPEPATAPDIKTI